MPDDDGVLMQTTQSYGELAYRGSKLRDIARRDPSTARMVAHMLQAGASDAELGSVVAMAAAQGVQSKRVWRDAFLKGWLDPKTGAAAVTSSWTTSQRKEFESMVAKDIRPKKQGCYVATSLYGSYDAPEVWVLRRWRDESLSSHASGRAAIRAYHRLSPGLVRRFGSRSWFTRTLRPPLGRLVTLLRARGYSVDPHFDER